MPSIQGILRSFSLKPKQASMVWLEPGRVHAGGRLHLCPEPLGQEQLGQILRGLPPGPSRWVVDDTWIPSVLLRDIVAVPAGAEREAFFRWRYSQSMASEAAPFVQALDLGGQAWLLAGMAQALRDPWLQAAAAAGHPIRSLLPRWLWLYNRLAPSRQVPGLLLSLGALADGNYTGTLVAWGRELILLRQWTEPASAELWDQERVLPTLAYLQREARSPQEIHLWGANHWPVGPLPVRILDPEIPSQEAS